MIYPSPEEKSVAHRLRTPSSSRPGSKNARFRPDTNYMARWLHPRSGARGLPGTAGVPACEFGRRLAARSNSRVSPHAEAALMPRSDGMDSV